MYLFCYFKIIKNYQNVLVKKSKDQCIGNHIKQKVRLEIQKMSINIFSNQTLQHLTAFLFSFIQMKIKIQKVVKLKDIISQKILVRIITSFIKIIID